MLRRDHQIFARCVDKLADYNVEVLVAARSRRTFGRGPECMFHRAPIAVVVAIVSWACPTVAAAGRELDDTTRQQAALEREELAAGKPHSQSTGIAEFRRTARLVTYPSGQYQLPGYLYKPPGDGPFAAVIWNHGSEKSPRAQAELARFYTAQGYVFFAPLRHGHGTAPGPYIGDLQRELRDTEKDPTVVQRKIVGLHELYNQDVIAAVAWLKQQPYVDREKLIMSGVSYGGIQTVLSAEQGLGMRGFVAFAPAAMSYANVQLRERLKAAVRNAQSPLFVLQAKNDYSTGPTEMLDPILKLNGEPSRSKLYGEFGSTHQHGHGAFACWSLGIMTWGNDVLEFIDAATKKTEASAQN